MPKKAQAAGRRKAAPAPPPRLPIDALAATGMGIVAILAGVIAGTSLAVDLHAAAAFDAPKRAVALIGTALAAALAAWLALRPGGSPDSRPWRPPSGWRGACLLLVTVAILGALVSALASPRRAVALDAMRTLALLSLLLSLGASRAVARGRAWLAGVFLAVCAINASVSILQGLGKFQPFTLETVASRQETGAFVGNVGYLAIALALGSVLALSIVLASRHAGLRLAAGASLALFAADLLVNRNFTALSSVLAGTAALLVTRLRRRSLVPLLAALAAAGVLVAAYPPVRGRVQAMLQVARAGDWDALLSYRGGPWAAALEMTRERPLLGFGPGTFAAEYVPHRLAAEIRARRRFVSPLITSSYGETHNDYLQALCDAGVPVALLGVAAVGFLLAGAARTAWRRADPEPAVLFALLVTGAVAALTWFPLQRPITAVPLLLIAGRAWRVGAGAAVGAEESDASEPDARHVRRVAWLAAALVLAALAAPEFSRYAAERRVGWATSAFRELLQAPEDAPTSRRLLATGEVALPAATRLPGDSRPWMIAASAFLLTGQPQRALELYREAFATGERSEIDLNLGRAYAALGRRDEADAAFLRAGWISPEILAALPETERAALLSRVSGLTAALREGRLSAPPPLPQAERR